MTSKRLPILNLSKKCQCLVHMYIRI
jgi:hypothetical protein